MNALFALDRLLVGYDPRYRLRLLVVLAIAAAHTLLVVLRPIPVKLLVETPAPDTWLARLQAWAGDAQGYVLVFLATLVVLEGLALALRIGNETLSTRISDRLMRNLRADIAGNLLRGRYDRVSRLGAGRVIAAMSGDAEIVQRLIKDVAIAATIAAFQLVLMVGVVFWVEPVLAGILFAEILLLSVMIHRYAVWRKHRFLEYMAEQEKYLGWVTNLYHKNLDLRFSQARNIYLQKIFSFGRSLYHHSNTLWFKQSRYFALIEFFLGLASAACLVYLFMKSRAGGQPLGDLLVFLYYTVLVFPCLSKLGEAVPLLTDASNAYGRLSSMIGGAVDEPPVPTPAMARRRDLPHFGTIELDRVGLQGADGAWIFRDISLTIAPGAQIALFGDSGTGKSTLLGMILGLVSPTEGAVRIGGIDATGLTLADRKRFFLFQRSAAAFFNGTVAENMALGWPLPETQARQLLEDIRLARRLEGAGAGAGAGLNMVMSELGQPFSQGEQQRLAIARAFLTRRPGIILDEALNSLDEASELAIVAALQARLTGRTLVMITHRRSVAETFPRVVYLKKGVGLIEGWG